MSMNAHNRGDDHLHGSIMRSNQTARDPIPHRSPTSANEAMLALNFPILLDNEVMDFRATTLARSTKPVYECAA